MDKTMDVLKKFFINNFALFFLSIVIPAISYADKPIKAYQAMVVSEQAYASKVGVDVLRAGGNAIDAAVAVGYALAVVNPCCGNIGGGGFMTLHLANGRNIFLNFRETAPAAAHPNLFLDHQGHIIADKSTLGYLAVAVPGSVMGLNTALKQYGKMSLPRVITPAIQLARDGFILSKGDIQLLNANLKYFKQQPNVAAIFLNSGKPYKAGDRLIQKDLAHTLKEISNRGSDAFYKGKIAKEIVSASKKHHGILSLKDFSNYRIEKSKPVVCFYHDYKIISAPPPSSGGITLCEMLNILEKYPLKKLGYLSPQGIHYIVEAMRFSFADRNNLLGDPNFVNNPTQQLISKDYAAKIRKRILPLTATPSLPGSIYQESMHTTHYSVTDKWGNAVSVTYTLNSFFGAEVIAGHTGFFLNNEMDDFTIKPGSKNQFGLVQGVKNNIQGGKHPLSSMTPTIVMKNNKVVLIVGSPGGPRIITSTLLTILNVIEYGMNIQDAVNAPRFHHQWLPDSIEIEPHAFSQKTIRKLKNKGYHFSPQQPWSAVEAIYIDPKSGFIYGANDKRRPAGKAVGY
jgi:gamma-glutamyltranspeptidase/glutathione hydrolase